MDEHIIEGPGKTKLRINNGKVVEVGEPQISYCPLFHKYRGIEKLNSETIKENIQFRIDDFGMCTKNRELRMKDFLSFGISETISTLLNENIIDCAIMVCEGCGTVIIDEAELAQGVGGRVSGLVSTTPISELIKEIGEDKVWDKKNANINQIEGGKLAIKNGYKNIAVTIAFPEDAKKLRELEKEMNKENKNIKIYIFGVHTTGLSLEESKEMFNYADVITACASKTMREIANDKAIFTVGQSIPIYAATEKGKEFLKLRLNKIGGSKPKKDNPKIPYPLI